MFCIFFFRSWVGAKEAIDYRNDTFDFYVFIVISKKHIKELWFHARFNYYRDFHRYFWRQWHLTNLKPFKQHKTFLCLILIDKKTNNLRYINIIRTFIIRKNNYCFLPRFVIIIIKKRLIFEVNQLSSPYSYKYNYFDKTEADIRERQQGRMPFPLSKDKLKIKLI